MPSFSFFCTCHLLLAPFSHALSLIFSIMFWLIIPSCVQLLQDAQASEGQVVVLECRVRGSPPLQVRWYRQGNEIQDSPDFRILQKSETIEQTVVAKAFLDFRIKLISHPLIIIMSLFSSSLSVICCKLEPRSAAEPGMSPQFLQELLYQLLCFHVPSRSQWLNLAMDYKLWLETQAELQPRS